MDQADYDERSANLYKQAKEANKAVADALAAYEAAVAHRANRLMVLNRLGESYVKIGIRLGLSKQRVAQIVAREASSA